MFKTVNDTVWVFDAEWVPDPEAGRKLYDLPKKMSDWDVMQRMWQEGGATEEDPRPFLKTALCRVVSISALIRKKSGATLTLELFSLPREESNSEKEIIERFLSGIGKHHPQLVGFNSLAADLRILIQRGVINDIVAKEFCARPEKPWLGVDYFAKDTESHIDLFNVLSSWGKGSPSLNEMAVLSGIPGKIDVDGNDVAELWNKGKLDQIIQYNEFDVLTTYQLWLRTAHFAGHIGEAHYAEEKRIFTTFLQSESKKQERKYLKKYLDRIES